MSARIQPSFDRFGREVDAAIRADLAQQRSAAVYYQRAAHAAMSERAAFWCLCRAFISRASCGRLERGGLGTPRDGRPARPAQPGSVS